MTNKDPSTIYALIEAHYAGKIGLTTFKEQALRISKRFNPEWGDVRLEKHVKTILERLEERHSVRRDSND